MTDTPDIAALRADPRVAHARDVLRFSDCDALGHVNNVVYATLCESGRVTFLRERLPSVERRGVAFVIVKLVIEFEAELHYPGEVETLTWLSRLGRTSFTLSQAILSGDTRAAKAEGVCVAIDEATRKPIAFEGETRAMMEGLVVG
ncbi:acyl-CoA thioesterase [Salinarimonas ramus]|uniref:Thioesterase n=1 Tax=Salinarimonas ramus TaxID=690164 RepID=A0A917Q608_9HYPH|nr:thioesterase family protein [Salinarimonas ramus]GGK26989.1 thioesterase [Salinarimonas ramus]